MRINNNVSALNTQKNLGIVNNRLSRTMEKLSSGLRIARAADDASGLVQSENLRSQIATAQADVQAKQNTLAATQIEEGTLSEASAVLIRVKELVTKGTDTSLDTTAKSAIEAELTELGTQLESLTTGIMTTAVSISTTATAGSVDSAINEVASKRGDIGATQNRLESEIRNLNSTIENKTSAESVIRDADMAKEMVQFTKDSIIQQAAQAMLVQANQLPQSILGLLK